MMFLVKHAPILAITVPLLAAFITPLISRWGNRIRNLWVISSLVLTEYLVFLLTWDVMSGNIHVYTLGAVVPALTSPAGFPVRIILEIDAMSALISFMALSIALIAAIYSWKFMEGYMGVGRFYSLFLLLVAGTMGMSFTGDFFTLFVFFEVVSLSSAGLVAFFRKGESFEAGFKYLVISATGALLLLFAVGLLYSQYNLLNMAAIAREIKINHSFLDVMALSLLVSALLLKAGSFPVHMWKVDAFQAAPASILPMCTASSLTSLYVLFRIGFSVFGLSINATLGWIIVTLGVSSIFVGVTMALLQNNLKRLIAYSAIAETGYVMLGVGAGLITMPQVNKFGFKALSGGIFHIVNDILDLGLLFLIAGAVFYITKKKDLNQLGGLAQHSRSLTALFMIGMLAVSGLPPFNGFASKLMIYESVFYFNPLLSIIGILGSIIMLAVFVKVFVSVFLGVSSTRVVKKIPMSMMIMMWVLAFFILFLGLFPQLPMDTFITPAAEALTHPQAYIGGII